MYIREFDYTQIAFVIVQKSIDSIKAAIAAGLTPDSSFDADKAINNYLPKKYNDENTNERSYWTKHNTIKLKKYISSEILRRRSMK